MLHQVARFSTVAPLIEHLGDGGTLLDVGSGSEGVAGWIGPGWTVTAVDRSFENIGALPGPRPARTLKVVGDACNLPFGDREFDVVVALDVLEHVMPKNRRKAIDEMVRVARRRVIVACPTGRAALAADGRLAEGLKTRGVPPPSWLAEHEENGFPDREELRAQLESHGELRLIGNENIRWHEWLFSFEFRRPGSHASRRASRAIVAGLRSSAPASLLSRIALRVARGPNRAPCYRTIAVLDLPDGGAGQTHVAAGAAESNGAAATAAGASGVGQPI